MVLTATSSAFAEKSNLLLEATLDSFPHAVWITDTNGNTILNSEAKAMVSDGFSIRNAMSAKDSQLLTYKTATYRVNRRELNHGTDCFLHELIKDDDEMRRLRGCAKNLDSALKRVHVSKR